MTARRRLLRLLLVGGVSALRCCSGHEDEGTQSPSPSGFDSEEYRRVSLLCYASVAAGMALAVVAGVAAHYSCHRRPPKPPSPGPTKTELESGSNDGDSDGDDCDASTVPSESVEMDDVKMQRIL